jgi:TetR/AcrR family transcriptional regulator, cholesterol catabolism regulator
MATRERILQESARFFAKDGYKATNLKQVADTLDVTRQALYYYFRSKSDILAALFDEVMSRMEESVDSALPVPGEAKFMAMVRAHVAVIVDNTDLVAVLLHERPEIAKLKKISASARRQAYMRQFVVAFEEGVKRGQIRDIDPQTAVNTLLAAANAVSAWYHAGSTEPPAVVAHRVTSILLAGVAADPTSDGRPTRRSAAKVAGDGRKPAAKGSAARSVSPRR